MSFRDIASAHHLSDTVPAFSSLGVHSTWIHESFFAQDGRIDEHLQAYVSLQCPARLDWVVGHELGHILVQHQQRAPRRICWRTPAVWQLEHGEVVQIAFFQLDLK